MLDLHDFLGDWRLVRRIDDRLSGQVGAFEGLARFVPDGEGLRCREEGALRLGDGPTLAATRDYLWRASDEGITVLFPDGRPFHGFVPSGSAIGTDHPCGADLYCVTYDFTAWPRWTTRWTVLGPRKDYAMASAYARA